MRKKNLERSAYVIFMCIVCIVSQVFAQTLTDPASTDKVKSALIVLEANMDSLKAHRTYIYAMGP